MQDYRPQGPVILASMFTGRGNPASFVAMAPRPQCYDQGGKPRDSRAQKAGARMTRLLRGRGGRAQMKAPHMLMSLRASTRLDVI